MIGANMHKAYDLAERLAVALERIAKGVEEIRDSLQTRDEDGARAGAGIAAHVADIAQRLPR